MEHHRDSLASWRSMQTDRERILAETGLSGGMLGFHRWVGSGGFRVRAWAVKLAGREVPVAVRNLRRRRDTGSDRLDRADIERRVWQQWGSREVRQSRDDAAWFFVEIDPIDEQALAQHLLTAEELITLEDSDHD